MLPDKITVVIPTSLRPERRPALERALASAVQDSEALHEVVMAANGPHATDETIQALRQMPWVRVLRSRSGSYPLARRIGIESVRSRYFCCLDDDDEFVAGALRARLDHMREHPSTDALVSNGFAGDSSDGQIDDDLLVHAARDPLGALLRGNWLVNCGGTFRTGRVAGSIFDAEFRHYEWTLAAIALALRNRVDFVTERHFRYHDTPDSLSKSDAYRLAEPSVWERAANLTKGTADWPRVRRRLGAAYHSVADQSLSRRELKTAWTAHLESLRQPGGLRYVAFSRHLLRASISSARP